MFIIYYILTGIVIIMNLGLFTKTSRTYYKITAIKKIGGRSYDVVDGPCPSSDAS
jgi:hypothetical protein